MNHFDTRSPHWLAWRKATSGGLLIFLLLLLARAVLPVQQNAASPVAQAAEQQPAARAPLTLSQVITDTAHIVSLPIIITPPQARTISIDAEPDRMQANGRNTSTLSALVLNSRNLPLPNFLIQFSATQGEFSNEQASIAVRTDAEGVARTELRAPLNFSEETTARISARVTNANGTVVSDTTSILLTPVSAERVTIRAASTRIPANGVSTTVVTATAQDAAGNGLPDLDLIFSTELGSFPNGNPTITVATNAQGSASTTLKSVFDIQTTSTKVSVVASDTGGASAETVVQFVAPGRVLLQALPASLPAVLTSKSVLRATVQDTTGAPIPFYPVDFLTTSGYFPDGKQVFRATTSAEGVASVDLFAAPAITTAAVSAQAGEHSGETSVTFTLAQCNDIEPNDFPRTQAKEQPPAACEGSLEGQQLVDPANPVNWNDWYYISLSKGQVITVDVSDIPAGSDYDLLLYDATLQQLAVSNNTGNTSERVTYTKTSGDTERYYIRINLFRASTTADDTYQLRLRVEPPDLPATATTTEEPARLQTENEESNPPLPPKP